MYLLAAAVAVIVYFFLIMPRVVGRPDMSGVKNRWYAHRGLHGGGITENSGEAFRRAAEAGCGIELDVRLSRDGVPVVCHDRTLARVHGVAAEVASLDARELERAGVPLLESLLREIGGRVPLIVEIKLERPRFMLCRRAADLLDVYEGKFCVQSFNPLALLWFRLRRPSFIRGQLSERFAKNGAKGIKPLFFLHQNMFFNFIARPDFIAFDFKHPLPFSVWLCRRLFGAGLFYWTVGGVREYKNPPEGCDGVIFEADF